MKNYAGHRLSPWLGHLMVSRQETARPLLTAGEVMQLPSDDELVLMSGCHPIRANKARYYENRELKARILPPPMLSRRSATMMTDWSSSSGAANWPAPTVGPSKSSPADPANSGIPREPDLPKNEEITPERPIPAQEFEPPEEESDDDAHRLRAFLRKVRIIRRK